MDKFEDIQYNVWANLCGNRNAQHLLWRAVNENPDLIDWHMLSANPTIFEDEPSGIK